MIDYQEAPRVVTLGPELSGAQRARNASVQVERAQLFVNISGTGRALQPFGRLQSSAEWRSMFGEGKIVAHHTAKNG